MQPQPPRELSDLLKRLDLATPDQLGRVRSRAVRLARQLPLFDSVWIDALVQARLLSPFQAAEINAGRGEQLAVGPYVLCQPLDSWGYARGYLARQRGSDQVVQLALASASTPDAQRTGELLTALAALHARLESPPLSPVQWAGIDGDRLWAAGRPVAGTTAAQWMVSNGRFPPQVVLELARQMLVGLVELERAGLCHGDLRAAGVVLSERGGVVLPLPGLRPILRREEGYSRAELLPEAYDYLAPERIAEGTAANVASEIYACGCLWWHLLAGRPPLPGGNSLAKLQAVHTAEIPEIGRLAPETPLSLAAAIAAALQRDPRQRPESMLRLAAMLGPPTRAGRAMLAQCLHRRGAQLDRWAAPVRALRRWRTLPLGLALVGGCLVAAAAIGLSLRAGRPHRATVAQERPTAEALVANSPVVPIDTRAATAVSPKASADLGLPDAARGDAAGKRLLLPADGAVAIDPQAILPEQVITGEPGKRPLVAVPPGGLVLTQERLRFENIDFVWEAPAADPSPSRPAAILHVQASRVEFRGCSFRAARPERVLPAAIHWTYPTDPRQAELSLPSGEVRLVDCVGRHVAAGVWCETRGAVALNVSNTLFLGRGPLLRMARWPQVDEPAVVRLSGVTLRESGPLLEVASVPNDAEPGSVRIVAEGCVFAPASEASLVRVAGGPPPDSAWKKLEWSGQGSLVSPTTPIAAWQQPGGPLQPLDDASIPIAGLVRSSVEFAGPSASGAEASRVVHWQVPLQSSNAPGIAPERLTEPRR